VNRRASCLLPLVLAAALLGACGAPQRAPSPPPPSVPIAFEAQGRLLQDARSLLTRGEVRDAARLLARLIATYPDSALLSEARWLLARCYEQDGRLQRALEQYELVAQVPGTPYTDQAVRRVTELRAQLRRHASRARVTNGLLLTADAFPTEPQLERLAAAGVTLAVIPVGSAAGVYFQTTLATVAEEKVTRLATVAHRHGILVYGAVSLDQMAWVSRSLGWHDVRYNPILGRLEPSAHLDLFNPAFQEYLLVLAGDLARSGVDGVLFRSAPARLDDGLSSFATEAFEREFHMTLDPATLLMSVRQSSHRNGTGTPGSAMSSGTPAPAEPAPVFWQWVGWKARSRAKLLDRMMEVSRRTATDVRFAVELHPESVTEPVKALAQYGEDVLAMNQTPADFLFFRYHAVGTRNGRSRAPVASDLTRTFLQRTGELLGGLERVWIVSGPESGETLSRGSLDPIVDRLGLPEEIGLIYEGRLSERFPFP
jgi:hypothetical protein